MSTRTRKPAPPSIGVLLGRAGLCIIKGEVHFRKAAEYIAQAAEQGATQRKIAAGVGKSVAWVNALLAWHRGGCQDTPFGSSAVQASHDRAVVQDLNKTNDETDRRSSQVDILKVIIPELAAPNETRAAAPAPAPALLSVSFRGLAVRLIQFSGQVACGCSSWLPAPNKGVR